MVEWIDETNGQLGTEFSRANMMAVQGFESIKTVFKSDGSIVETNALGQTLTTTFNSDGSIIEKFVGDKIITKTTIFNSDGSIEEVLS